MTDRILIELCDGWALGYDPNQWVVLRRRNLRTQIGWKPVAYIGSAKRILHRVLRENDIIPSPEAAAYIDAMPVRFLDWLELIQSNQEAAE